MQIKLVDQILLSGKIMKFVSKNRPEWNITKPEVLIIVKNLIQYFKTNERIILVNEFHELGIEEILIKKNGKIFFIHVNIGSNWKQINRHGLINVQ